MLTNNLKSLDIFWLDNLINKEVLVNSECARALFQDECSAISGRLRRKVRNISARSWVRYVLTNCTPGERLKDFFDMSHLMQVKWLGDNKIELFLKHFDSI
jgi:hypothetical protein